MKIRHFENLKDGVIHFKFLNVLRRYYDLSHVHVTLVSFECQILLPCIFSLGVLLKIILSKTTELFVFFFFLQIIITITLFTNNLYLLFTIV